MRPEHREHLLAPPTAKTMTIGELSKRTGESVKQLRRYEDLGFIYTVGRSAGCRRFRRCSSRLKSVTMTISPGYEGRKGIG